MYSSIRGHRDLCNRIQRKYVVYTVVSLQINLFSEVEEELSCSHYPTSLNY